MTAYTGPTLPREIADHDLWRTHYDPHFTDFGKAVFDPRCRRCWYEKAKAEDAPLLEAANLVLLQHPFESTSPKYNKAVHKLRVIVAALSFQATQVTGKE